MMFEGRMFKVLLSPYVSEKSSTTLEKYNTIILKVARNSTKSEIKIVIKKLFAIIVDKVNIVIIKGKSKRLNTGRISVKSDWKKAYVTIKKGQRLDFLGMKKIV